MAIPHAKSGELIDLMAGGGPGSLALVRDEHFEVYRLAMEAGKALPEHSVASLVTIQCLSGRVELDVQGRPQAMRAGTMVYLAGGVAHSVRALEDSRLLVTQLVSRE